MIARSESQTMRGSSRLSLSHRTKASAASRRSFLRLGAGCALARLSPWGGPWIVAARAQSARLDEMPHLDGEYRVDDAARSAVAADFGHAVRRMPRAVAKTRTVDDIVRVVLHANRRGLKVAMRGQAHSLSGQTLVDDGIVIDSAPLAAIDYKSDDILDAQSGALWGDVAKAALAHGRLPPVMPDAMMLSVGGTLSVGGVGETSWRLGAQVDHVRELDVVTGVGDFVTCSATREPELFAMMLAGMGQCGLIVRARLVLAQAANFVATRTLTYSDLDAFLADQARLTESATLGPLNGQLIRNPQGRWDCLLAAGSFIARDDEARYTPDWMDGLRPVSAAPAIASPIWNYLDRRTASVTAGKAKSLPNPSLIVRLPAGATRPFIAELLASPKLSDGIWFFEVSVKVPSRHRQPLHKMPIAAIAYELRMQRRPSAAGAPDHDAMLAANRLLAQKALDMGGKIYPPFAPILMPSQWKQHFGPATWARFKDAKQRFDPNHVLNPGAGIF
jgi:cytokinin dehydrogenase